MVIDARRIRLTRHSLLSSHSPPRKLERILQRPPPTGRVSVSPFSSSSKTVKPSALSFPLPLPSLSVPSRVSFFFLPARSSPAPPYIPRPKLTFCVTSTEAPRDRKKDKNIKHTGNAALDEIIDIARIMRSKSLARELSGTVKEMLGTAQSLGCTVDGRRMLFLPSPLFNSRLTRSDP